MKTRRPQALCVAFGISIAATISQANAEVKRIAIESKVVVANGSDANNEIGNYEIITGRAYGTLDPTDPLNAIVTDIALAPRNADGLVEYDTKFTLAKPVDMDKASGVLWYDIVNRGTGAAAPNAYGHVQLLSGWQGDIPQKSDNYAASVPVAINSDGTPVTGKVLARIVDAKPGTNTMPLAILGRAIPYDAASLDTKQARLIKKSSEKRSGEVGPVKEVSPTDWAFADCKDIPFPGKPDPRKICLKDGFDPHFLYEVVYNAKDPLVLGIGLAGIRDVASFFRYESRDRSGNENPVGGQIKHAIIKGVSQSGNTLKTFLLLGFNEDEKHRIVFDGASPHIAGRLTTINVRFGLPSGSGTLYEPGGEGVLWWSPYEDKVRGRAKASLLDRCIRSKTCPKIMETFGAAEFNARLFTIALVGTDRKADLPLPDNVRRYYFPGTTHGGADTTSFEVAGRPSRSCVLAENPNAETEQMNALAVALVDWVVHGVEPPPSSYPTLAHGDLAENTSEAMGFPGIPGVLEPTGLAIGLMDYDFGKDLNYNDFSGALSKQPPDIKQTIPPFMPRVNADGNETSGIPSVLHAAPLGTYTGWNATAGGFFKGQPCGGGLTGGYVPFAATKEQREQAGDPRPSLEERYGTKEGYLCEVKAAVKREIERRFLLRQDADKLIRRVEGANILPEADQASPVARSVAQQLCKD
ncbi:alpha/beta hydrolase domain-containing protein [Phyllobacterium sp. 21LDTY02-6]|uniref:alpha/beta hydrolase domain-containing protein n=1 Tax=Phyllobacterium sp. 21LDTY02-6 TaxID=2944903 RepID=UPI002021473D|nr:alpha/beta hydrolase domain-containing protein [Phyllobacterium sp. 21LDTY02-6]MCO4319173.1 alpha/beta hydrolase domain-containing protein [Phyllobacterium sp. 21LDTY02-6]